MVGEFVKKSDWINPPWRNIRFLPILLVFIDLFTETLVVVLIITQLTVFLSTSLAFYGRLVISAF